MTITARAAECRNGVWVRNTIPGDDRALLSNMRRKDIEECLSYGISPGRALKSSVRQSLFSRTAWKDGVVIGMWGLSGPIISEIGVPWLLTGNGIEKVPITFAKLCYQDMELMLQMKKTLMNYVSADYKEAVNFFRMLGFTIYEPTPEGKYGNLFHKIVKER